MAFDHISRSPEDTMNLGRIVAGKILPGDILAFSGDLGAGKTCLIQGICRGLDVPEHIYITSPSFVILNRYEGRLPIYHFDFYRLSCQDEILDLGYEEYFFGEGVSLIEWAERAEGILPEAYLKIRIKSLSPSDRSIEFIAYGEGYMERFCSGSYDLSIKTKSTTKGG